MISDWIDILPTPLMVDPVVTFITHPTAGGVDIFLGTTRQEKSREGLNLLALDYQAYHEMALARLNDLATSARKQWPIVKLAILHRTGRVAPGEPSVIIAVSCPHR